MKFFLSTLILLFAYSITNGQDTNKNNDKVISRNFFTGGNLSLTFGNVTYVEVAPIFGYRFNNYLAAGIGGTYQYYRQKTFPHTIFETHIYGGNLFGRIYFFQDFFIQAEYEILSMETEFWDPYHTTYANERFLIGNALAGLGYRQALGEKVFSNIMLLYNFNETIFTPYSNPVIKVGIDINL